VTARIVTVTVITIVTVAVIVTVIVIVIVTSVARSEKVTNPQFERLSFFSFFRMSSLLENYLESIQDLPSEVRRNFALMRELDIQSQRTKSKREREKRFFFPSSSLNSLVLLFQVYLTLFIKANKNIW
jgi:hypothetical protein